MPAEKNVILRCASYAIQRFWDLQYAYPRFKYRRRAFDKVCHWEWEKTNYNRIALVNFLISKTNATVYLEIGCHSNSLFDSVPLDHKLGIDPVVGGNVRTTSDEFFKSNHQLFEMVFIDGLHTYDQVRRDVINSINFLKPGGYIALHDMLPSSWLEHHVPRLSGEWTGDVWKVAFELANTAGLDFKIVKIDHGVGVFRLTKDKPQLADLTRELTNEGFRYFYENHHRLPIVEWEEFVRWVGQKELLTKTEFR